MFPSRRVFLTSLASAGAMAAVSRTVRASLAADPLNPLKSLSVPDGSLHRDKPEIRLGCAAITWSDQAELAIEDIAADGYSGIQLRAPTLNQYPDPHTLRDLLARKSLTFVALSSGSTSLDPAQRQSQLETHVKHAQYVHEAGGLYMQLTSATTRHGETFPPDQFKLQGEIFSEIGEHIAKYGVRLGFHNHMNSIGQPPEAVEAIMAASDPNYVFLLLDVAHYAQGGGDPVAAIRKYDHRILFMHFKDVKDAPTPSGYEWVELGQGRLDFPAIIAALNVINFQGWGVVELDRVPTGESLTPKEANAVSLKFLRKQLGIHA